MPIHRDDEGFIVWPEDRFHRAALGIESQRLKECVQKIRERDLKGVFGTVPYFVESDLDFLSLIEDIEEAQFYDVSLKSINGLYLLRALSYLRISGKRPPIQFERFQNLRSLVVQHNVGDRGFADLPRLEMMHSWRFKTPDKTSYQLELPRSLLKLGIFWWSAETIEPLGPLPKLRVLEIGRCRNLAWLGDLRARFPALERLTITASGRLSAAEAERAIADHPTLRHVFAGNKLLLGAVP